jgi:hypothetical protein
MAKSEVAVKEEKSTALALSMEDMGADAGGGFEGVTAKDVTVPYLAILQSGSPQVKKGDPAQIPGAAEGDIFNTASKEVYKEGLRLIPCAFQKRYVEWVDRDQGGGFVASHADEAILSQTTKDDKGKARLANGNVIVTTAYHYVLVLRPDGSFYPAIMAMASTQLKKSRDWIGLMQGLKIKTSRGPVTPATYSHSYKCGTTTQKNNFGTWQGWDLSAPAMLESNDLYAVAKAFSQSVNEGTVKAADPVAADVQEAGDAGESKHF